MLSNFTAFSHAVTLDELILVTLQTNPELRSSLFLQQASESEVDSARWQFFPTPSVSVQRAEVSSSDTTFIGDDYTATVGFVQPLWAGGTIKHNLNSAKISLALSETDVAQTQQDLTLNVLSAYSDWLSSTLRVESWQDGLAIHQQLLGQIQRRASGGASSESDIALVNARLTLAEAELYSVVAQQQVALSNLNQLVGVDYFHSELTNDRPSPIRVAGDQIILREKARNFSPSLIRAQLEVDLAETEKEIIRSEQLPTVNLRVERQYGDLTTVDAESSNRIFIELTSRFGAGLSSVSDASAASSRRDAALANVNTQRRELYASLAADMALKNSIEQRIGALNLSRQATQTVYESFERQFLSGSRTWLDVLNSAREITQLDVQMADAQASLILVSWRLSVITEGISSVVKDSNFNDMTKNNIEVLP